MPAVYRKKKGNDRTTKESGHEMRSDKKSANLLAEKSSNYLNEKNLKKKNRVAKKPAKVLPHQIKKKKVVRTYTDQELGIPKLNKSIDPEGFKVKKGKKGKKFVNEDALKLMIADISEQYDNRNASKLERARQLEQIREAKRKEIEKKEKAKESKLDQKKQELKKKTKPDGKTDKSKADKSKADKTEKSKAVKTDKSKSDKADKSESASKSAKPKKRVSFA